MGAPQVIYLILAAISVADSIRKDGEPRPPYNKIHTLIGLILSLGLLNWGGFFR